MADTTRRSVRWTVVFAWFRRARSFAPAYCEAAKNDDKLQVRLRPSCVRRVRSSRTSTGLVDDSRDAQRRGSCIYFMAFAGIFAFFADSECCT